MCAKVRAIEMLSPCPGLTTYQTKLLSFHLLKISIEARLGFMVHSQGDICDKLQRCILHVQGLNRIILTKFSKHQASGFRSVDKGQLCII